MILAILMAVLGILFLLGFNTGIPLAICTFVNLAYWILCKIGFYFKFKIHIKRG